MNIEGASTEPTGLFGDGNCAWGQRGAACFVGLWTLGVFLSGRLVNANRMDVDGIHPPHLIPINFMGMVWSVTLFGLLLIPWSSLCWRQLRCRTVRKWDSCDLYSSLAIFVTGFFGVLCEFLGRDQPSSTMLTVGTSIFGFVGVTTLSVVAVRLVVATVASLWTKSVWRFESRFNVAALIVFALLYVGFGLAPPQVQDVKLCIAGLPVAAENYALCMISDLHAGPVTSSREVRAVAEQTSALGCNAVVLNGDLAEGTVAERSTVMEPLLILRSAPDGVYYVPGNHEFYNFGGPRGPRAAAVEWTTWWEAHGVVPLNNSHVELPRAERAWFSLAGVDDVLGSPNLTQALGERGLPIVLAAHRPTPFARQAAAAHVAAQISGHTHGGQMWPIHVLASKASGGLLSGLYDVGSMPVYVSDGTIGSAQTRLRFLTRSEITRFFLTSSPVRHKSWMRPARLGLKFAWAAMAVATLLVVFLACDGLRKHLKPLQSHPMHRRIPMDSA